MSSILAIDYGTKNIGLALTDAILRIPYPLESVPNDKKIIDTIARVVKDHEVAAIVIGLPTHTYGNEGESAELARLFGEKLKVLELPIIFEDERFSSALVKKLMAEDKNYDKDAIEAAVILESYLQRENRK